MQYVLIFKFHTSFPIKKNYFSSSLIFGKTRSIFPIIINASLTAWKQRKRALTCRLTLHMLKSITNGPNKQRFRCLSSLSPLKTVTRRLSVLIYRPMALNNTHWLNMVVSALNSVWGCVTSPGLSELVFSSIQWCGCREVYRAPPALQLRILCILWPWAAAYNVKTVLYHKPS